MQVINRLGVLLTRLVRFLRGPLLILASWLSVVGIGAVCFASGTPTRSDVDEFIAFTSSFSIAVATSASMTLLGGRRRRLAIEAVLSIAIASLTFASIVYACLWLIPSLPRSLMGAWEFLRLRSLIEFFAPLIVKLYGPIGAILGVGVGLVAGVMIRLYSHRPRLVAALAIGILLTCACGQVLSAGSILLTNLLIEARLDHGHMHAATVRGDEIAVTLGAVTGAIVGATGAWIVARVGATQSPDAKSAPDRA
jgi:hypothetical protein